MVLLVTAVRGRFARGRRPAGCGQNGIFEGCSRSAVRWTVGLGAVRLLLDRLWEDGVVSFLILG